MCHAHIEVPFPCNIQETISTINLKNEVLMATFHVDSESAIKIQLSAIVAKSQEPKLTFHG